jgi:hypothetical protein
MSTDVIALFEPSVAITADWLFAKLTANPEFASEVIERYKSRWRAKAWTITESPVDGHPELFGPGGFAISLKPQAIVIYHMMPFRIFTSDKPSRQALRQALLEVADLTGSAHAIITHELMPCEGERLDEIEQNLRTRIGAPATTFEELEAAEYFEPRAWYIDTFADLRQTRWR